MSVLTETLPVEQQAGARSAPQISYQRGSSGQESEMGGGRPWPGIMDNLGKDKEDFRGFRNVCTSVHGHLGQHKEGLGAVCIKMEVGLLCYCLHKSQLQEDDPRYPIVRKLYTEMYKNQTVESVGKRARIP